MQLGQRHRQVIGLAILAIAFGVPAVVTRGEPATPLPALRGIAATVDADPGAEPGGSLTATVSWPAGAADLSEICVVLLDEDGGVVDEPAGALEAIPGRPGAARWTVGGLATGRYTVHVTGCVPPAGGGATAVEAQYLGGGHRAGTAEWVEVTRGDRVDVGAIALRRARS
jgi:hypothetical protein